MARAWHLMRRPVGMPVAEDFALKDVALPDLGDGMVRVRNRFLSVDPYMRGRMNDVKSYVPPFQLDAPMDGRRGRRGGRKPRPRLRARRHGGSHGGLARRGRGRGQGAQQIARSGRRAAAIPRQPRADRGHGIFRAARGGAGQGGRHRVRLGGGGRGRLGGGPDRQGQGHDRDRIGGGRRQSARS